MSALLDQLNEPVHYLSDLLPYDPSIKTGKRLVDGLKELLLLFTAFELTIDALQKNELKKFDPLVGENACQIRAVKLALILSKCSFDWSKFTNLISESKNKLGSLLSLVHLAHLSLRDIITNENLDIRLSKIELFLIKSFLLTKTKVSKPNKDEAPLLLNEFTDTKKIKEISHVGSMFADNLVKSLREKLSVSSVEFVQRAALDLDSQNYEMLSDDFSFDHRGLKCLPCYWTNCVLMQQTFNHQIPIVMLVEQKAEDRNYEVVEKTIIYFKYSAEGYVPTTQCDFDPLDSALILSGSSCKKQGELLSKEDWIKELVELCPTDMIKAYAAAHRQYPIDTQDELFEKLEDPHYLNHKVKAQQWGCSLENPSRFFLGHAFCDTIQNVKLYL